MSEVHKLTPERRAQKRAWHAKNRKKSRDNARDWAKLNPEKRKASMREYYLRTQDRRLAERKRHYRTDLKFNREEAVDSRLRRLYGIDGVIHRECILASQGYMCKLCGTSSPGNKKGWHVDHCHKTGKVRGVLCHHCNVMLANAKDDIETLFKAIAYLKEFVS